MESENQKVSIWLDRPLIGLASLNIEKVLVTAAIILAVFSRFYMLGDRTMSHDEVNHVVPSWELFQGQGYRHDPVTHGPFQFHVVALTYFLLGDNDFTSRTPAALLSIGAVIFVLFGYRRYLGRAGALLAGLFFLISPFLLFYGRYTRNEGFIELFGVVMIYATLRYLERGERWTLYLLTAATVLHFTAKETAFIYTAQFLLFVAIVFIFSILKQPWGDPNQRRHFLLAVVIALLALGGTLGFSIINAENAKAAASTATAAGASGPAAPLAVTPMFIGQLIALLFTLISALFAAVILVRSLGWKAIRSERSFDIMIMIGTFVLPQLAAIPVKLAGIDPLNYSDMTSLIPTAIALAVLFAISIAVGIWWKPAQWVGNAALFWGTYIVLYTTFFTNGRGFLTGIVGSLGYWLSQQGVERGSQPWYYFGLIQLPIYEYLALLGTAVAVYFGVRYRKFITLAGISPAESEPGLGLVGGMEREDPDRRLISSMEYEEPDPSSSEEALTTVVPGENRPVPVLAMLVFWSLTSLVAYSLAGEKMPWLTVHIALPFLLTAGWGLGYLVDTTPWQKIVNRNGLIVLLLMPVFLTGFAGILGNLLGSQPPFQGKQVDQLETTGYFFLYLIVVLLSGYGITYFLKDWAGHNILRLLVSVFFALLVVLTARTAAMASYINYDYATEYLVYAHGAPGPKQVLAQVEEISRRTTGGLKIAVAYDNDALYPYWWYFRNYPNKRWFTDKPTRDLRDAPVIISGEATMNKMEPIVKDNFVKMSYIRLWWPNQDYFGLTWARIWGAVSNPKMREAIFDIWLNRDYKLYGEVINSSTLTLENWDPASRMDVYIRKDVVSQIWNFGVAPVAQTQTTTDPYEKGIKPIAPDQMIGETGNQPGQFQAPRGLAVAADGTLYVADSRNNRIQHLTADGKVLITWGTFGDASQGPAAGGTFNEPWGIAVAPDGSVFVADTWNHRVQKFTADGKFVKMWGYFGQAEKPDAFWGPRDIAIDSQGRVYITDTGNKRIAIFTKDGDFVSQFGTAGVDPGQFDEPVGLAMTPENVLYVADTWNQRIQLFTPDADFKNFTPLRQWDIAGWFGQSLDNKPFLKVDTAGNSFVVDPEGPRILEFDQQGKFLQGWGDYTTGGAGGTIYAGIALDGQGNIYISDAANNHVIRFKIK